MSLAGLVMDGVLITLLLAALLFGLRLDRRLKTLRAGQEAFARAVAELDSAAIRAHQNLRELHSNAEESQELLHGRILAARDLIQKLEAAASRAERIQGRLDDGVRKAQELQVQEITQIPASLRAQTLIPESTRLRDAPLPREERREERRTDRPSPGVTDLRRGAFARDVVKPALEPEPVEEHELIDKVQMSELVVANLNEMIRTLNMPKRRAGTVEDELFGQN